jgi:hypothetical protein
MSEAIAEQLKKFMEANEIVSVYSDPTDMSACSVGYIDAIDEAVVRIRAVSRYGSDAGYELRPLNNICRIDAGGLYEKKLAFLREHSAEVFHDLPLANAVNKEDDLIFCTLREAETKRLIVVLWTEDENDSIVGYVGSVDYDLVKILSIDDYGRENGYILLRYQDIRAVDCNTNPAQVLKFLHTHWTAGA